MAIVAAVAAAPMAVLAQEPEEIVVTVRQREESLRDVPGAVAAFSAEDLEAAGVQRARDFIALTPGVSIVNAAEVADSQVNIRGMNGARDAETNFALIIDGILMTNPAALNREYTNLAAGGHPEGPAGRHLRAQCRRRRHRHHDPEARATRWAATSRRASRRMTPTCSTGHVGGPMTSTIKWELVGRLPRHQRVLLQQEHRRHLFAGRLPGSGLRRLRRPVQGLGRGRAAPVGADRCRECRRQAPLRQGRCGLHHLQLRVPPAGPCTGFGAAFAENVNDHTFGFYPNIKPFNNQESTEFSVKVDDDLGFADLTAWGLYSKIDNDFGADGTSAAFGFFNTEQRCIDTTDRRTLA